MDKLSILIPAWNEGNHIYKNLKKVCELLENSWKNYEIIVIDDGSSDNTYEKAKKASRENRRIKVVRKKHRGKGSALKFGFKFCSGDLITTLDADLEINPKHILCFIDYLRKYKADVIVGSKRHPLSKIDYPLFRRFLSFGYQILVKILFNLNLRDTQAGLKLFKRKVLEKILPKILCKRYAFDLEVLVNANYKGFKIREAPIELKWKRVSSRIRAKDVLGIFLDTLAIFYRLKILKYYE